MPGRSYDDEYVLNLQSELEDETRLRGDIERTSESLESRLKDFLDDQARKDGVKDLFDSSCEILRDQLVQSQSDLKLGQENLTTVNAELETLHLQLGHLRSEVNAKDEQVVFLESELEGIRSINESKDQKLVQAQEELERSTDSSVEKEGELLAVLSELESLKRDATLLRHQLLSLQQHQQVAKKTPSPPKTRHYRTSSAPFSPSPLRHASFPPPPSSVSPSSAAPPLFGDAFSGEDQAIILVSRLRQERDEAVSQLSYYLLEHRISAQCLNDELEQVREERQALQNTLNSQVQEDCDTRTSLQVRLSSEQAMNKDAQLGLRDALLKMAGLQHSYERSASIHTQVAVVSISSLSDSVPLDLKRSIMELHARIASLDASLVKARHADGEQITQIKQLQEERECLSDSLSQAERELLGARNAALGLRKRVDDSTNELTLLRKTSAEDLMNLQDQLSYTAMQLEGARNAALELENRAAPSNQGNEKMELSLRQQRDEMFQHLLQELVEKDLLRSEMTDLKEGSIQMQAQIMEQEHASRNMIVALIQAGHQSLTASKRIVDVQNDLQHARSSLIEQEHLAMVQSNSNLAVSSQLKSRDEEVQQLILYLVQASAEISRLRNVILENRARRDEEMIIAGRLRGQLDTAQERTAQLEECLALQQSVPAAAKSDAWQEEISQLTKQLDAAREELAQSYQIHSQEVEERLQSAVMEVEQLRNDLLLLGSTRDELAEVKIKEASLLRELKQNASIASEREEIILGLREELAIKQEELFAVQESLARGQKVVISLENRMRVAEEEGQNLVMDFNLLSEELENRQKVDETR